MHEQVLEDVSEESDVDKCSLSHGIHAGAGHMVKI